MVRILQLSLPPTRWEQKTAIDKSLLKEIASWPEADQQELVEVAREIESRRTGIYRLSDAERAAVREGIDAADVGHFAPEDEMEEYYRLHRGV
jgi:predicted transcriptional regulator